MHRPMVEGPCGHGRGADEPLTRFPPTTFPPRRSSESGTGGPKSEPESGSPSEPDLGSPGPAIEGKLHGARNASPFRSRNASSFWSRFLARVARIFRTGMAISGHTSPAVFRTSIFRFSLANHIHKMHRPCPENVAMGITSPTQQPGSNRASRKLSYWKAARSVETGHCPCRGPHGQKAIRFLSGPSLPWRTNNRNRKCECCAQPPPTDP